MVEKKAIRALVIAAVASSLVVGCAQIRPASAGGNGTGEAARVIRDPDNPAYTGAVLSGDASTAQVVRDPDNPFWSGNTASGSSYVEPVRGPR